LKKEKPIIIIDMDGTLVDTDALLLPVIFSIIKEHDLTAKLPLIVHMWSEGKAVENIITDLGLSKDIIARMKSRLLEKLTCTNFMPAPGSKDALEYFKKEGYSLSLATNNIKKITTYILAASGLDTYFDDELRYYGDDGKQRKYERSIIDDIKLKYGGNDLIIIGNSTDDVLLAQKSGISAIVLEYPFGVNNNILKENPYDYLRSKLVELRTNSLKNIRNEIRKVQNVQSAGSTIEFIEGWRQIRKYVDEMWGGHE
jgi:phosphoglycolate phosphatase-like HAD superfamily hydrolase